MRDNNEARNNERRVLDDRRAVRQPGASDQRSQHLEQKPKGLHDEIHPDRRREIATPQNRRQHQPDRDERVPASSDRPRNEKDAEDDRVTADSEASFPASDPPSWTPERA